MSSIDRKPFVTASAGDARRPSADYTIRAVAPRIDARMPLFDLARSGLRDVLHGRACFIVTETIRFAHAA